MAAYDPFSREVMADPLPFYRALRSRGRAHSLPRYDAWALPRFDDVWHVLQDRERFTIVEGPIFARDRLLAPNDAPLSTTVDRPIRTFSMIDPPTHTQLRRAMLPPFLPRAVATLEADVRAHVRALLDELIPRGGFDAVGELGSPVAAAATCRLLGVPADDHATIVRQVNAFTRREPGEPGMSPVGRDAQVQLHRYLTEWVAGARGRGGLVDLLAAYDTGSDEPLSDQEIAVQVNTLLVDAEVAGVEMTAGQRVFLLLVSANFDEREFPDPERFDIRRTISRTLVFGHGVHVCIGAHAARLEGRVILEELLARAPDYEIDPQGIERPPSEFQVGYTAMPVRC